MQEGKEEQKFKNEIEKDVKTDKKYHEIVAGSIILIIFAVFAIIAIWWYLDNQQINDDINTNLNYKKITSSDISEDENSSWKTYTSSKYGFSIKYPGSWTVIENAESNGGTYVGTNVFSSDNVVFDNKADQYAISISVEDIIGRGGTCVKRNIIYNTSIVNKKITLVKASDTNNSSKPLGEDMMCGGAALSGYAISTVPTSGNYQQFDGINYLFHSESTTLEEAKVDEVAEYFEKIMKTMTWE